MYENLNEISVIKFVIIFIEILKQKYYNYEGDNLFILQKYFSRYFWNLKINCLPKRMFLRITDTQKYILVFCPLPKYPIQYVLHYLFHFYLFYKTFINNLNGHIL